MPYKVLNVIDHLGLGGAQTFLSGFLGAWKSDNYIMDVAALHGPGEFSAKTESVCRQLVHLAPKKRAFSILGNLKKLIQRENYDIVHGHLIPSIFLCEQFRRYLGIKNLISHVHAPYGRSPLLSFSGLTEPFIYRNPNLILGCSKDVLESIPRRGIESRIIYNGIDTDKFRPFHPDQKTRQREKLGIAADCVVLGYAGRLSREKNPLVLLEALNRIKHSNPKLIVLFVGSGKEEPMLRNYVDRENLADRVIFSGFSDAIEDVMACFDIFVFPSRHEGLGISLIEAMACELPVISSDYSAAHEVVTENTNALLFRNGDHNSLANAIERLTASPELATDLGRQARIEAVSRFSIHNTAREIENAYSSLMASEWNL